MSKANFEVHNYETLKSTAEMKLMTKFCLYLHNFSEL